MSDAPLYIEVNISLEPPQVNRPGQGLVLWAVGFRVLGFRF